MVCHLCGYAHSACCAQGQVSQYEASVGSRASGCRHQHVKQAAAPQTECRICLFACQIHPQTHRLRARWASFLRRLLGGTLRARFMADTMCSSAGATTGNCAKAPVPACWDLLS